MQSVAIYIILGAAIVYMGRKAYLALKHKDTGGCAHCDPADVNKLKKTTPAK